MRDPNHPKQQSIWHRAVTPSTIVLLCTDGLTLRFTTGLRPRIIHSHPLASMWIILNASTHKMLNKCWVYDGGPTLNQHWFNVLCLLEYIPGEKGGGPRVVVSTAAFHARVRGSVPGLGGLKETKLFLPHPRVKVSIVGSLRDREVACSASDRQGSNFESCVWRTVSSQSSHHPQEVLLAQFSLYVHKGGLKSDSFHFYQVRKRVSLQFTNPNIFQNCTFSGQE